MKKWILTLPLAAIVAVVLTACEGNNPAGLGPTGPEDELVDVDLRVDEEDVNARVYLSFAIPFEVEVEGGGTGVLVPVAQEDGPALNFPGNPKNAGTCEAGTWKNRNGHGMGGTEEQPHPHCTVWEEENGSTVETVYVVLEPISANYQVQNANQHRLHFTNEPGDNGAVKILNNAGELEGNGEIVAWAVFQDDPGQRVGYITIDLEQFNGEWDDMDCTVSGDPNADGCLKLPVTFTYTPVGEDDGGYGENGFGVAGTYGPGLTDPDHDTDPAGFLWWESVGPGWYRAD